MAVNPCLCMALQKGCMALAILDAVISMVNLGLMVLSLVEYIKYDDKDPDLTKTERTIGIVIVIVLCIICILQVLLAFRLYYGAKKRDYRNCRIWLIITTIVTIINIINFVLNFTATDLNEFSFSGALVNILYKVYEMVVVYCFLQELKQEVFGLTTVNGHPQQYQTQAQPQYPATVYVTPQSQQAYPMQQFVSYPTIATSQGYPAPVHHVTTTTIS